MKLPSTAFEAAAYAISPLRQIIIKLTPLQIMILLYSKFVTGVYFIF